jgi:hypothetical protein
MKSLRLHYLVLVTLIFAAVCSAQHHHSGNADAEESASENPNLVDEFGNGLGHCDLTGRYDLFFAQLSEKQTSHGYILIYQGTDGLPANYDSPPMERMFRNHLMFRRFDASRVTIINGGFQEAAKTQLWIVPPGAKPPTPESTHRKPEIPEDKTFLFDRGYIALEDEYDGDSEYVLPSVKAEREAQQKELEEEARLERLASGEEEEEESEPVSEESEATTPDETEVETLTEEEKIEQKFHWVSQSYGSLLAKREGSRGVVIFYADDKHFDIAKIRSLVEEGVQHLSKSAELKGRSISVVFGGYRIGTDVEFWVVPKKGIDPVPKPSERQVEEPEGPADGN